MLVNSSTIIGDIIFGLTTTQASTPTFSPVAGSYSGSQSVAISCSTVGSTIYYTTNGSTPTTSSSVYSTTLTVSSSETLKAIAIAAGFTQSPVGSAAYTITTQTATPTFSPAAGAYSSSQIVTISCSTGGSTIYYTTDGTTPTTSSSVYSISLTVNSNETIKAIATAAGFTQSAVGSALYTFGGGGGGSSIPGWPFTMGYAIGNNQSGDYKNPAWRAAMSRFNMNVVTQFPGLEGTMGLSFDFIFSDIKSRAAALPFPNPQCLTGFYIIEEEMYDPAFSPFAADLHTGLYSEATAKNWFLYSGGGSFPSGGHVIDRSYGTATLNMTDQTPVSNSGWSSGNNYAKASVVYYNNWLIQGNGAAVNQSSGAFAANTHCDFIYHDNQWNLPRAGTGQYLCTSATQNNGDTTVGAALQRGYAQNIAKWRSLQPSMLQAGNCDWIAQVSGPSLFDSSCIGLYDRPFQEILFSTFQFAIGVFFPPATTLAKLAIFEQNLLSTNSNAIPIASADGIYPGAAFPASQANWGNVLTSNQPIAGDHANVVWSGNVWQGARMITCFLLLRGWGSALYNNTNNDIPYLDEYNKGGTAASNWIKTWIDGKQTAPWSNGVYRRRANECIVYYNPPDNGSRIINATGYKIPNGGYSDPAVNNGQFFNQFTLKAGDGLITLPLTLP